MRDSLSAVHMDWLFKIWKKVCPLLDDASRMDGAYKKYCT